MKLLCPPKLSRWKALLEWIEPLLEVFDYPARETNEVTLFHGGGLRVATEKSEPALGDDLILLGQFGYDSTAA